MKKLILSAAIVAGFSSTSIAQNGLNFEGASDIVQTNYTGVTGSLDRTFEAWVYYSSAAPAANLCILDYGTNASGDRNTFQISANRQLNFTSGGTNGNLGTGNAGDVPMDQWVHVAFVLNSGTGYLYVNGVELVNGNLTGVSTPTNGEDLKLGQRVAGGSIPFHGVIDEVRVWSTARTQAEIQANMNIELCSMEPNLELYLRFNQGIADGSNAAVTTASDDSGNNHVASLNSFALTGTTSNWVLGAAITPGFSTGSVAETECNSFLWADNSTTYTATGMYTAVLAGANSAGCDSIVTLDLTINTSSDLTTNLTECDSYLWPVNNQTYMTSTTVVEPLTTTQGCAYNHTLNLIVGETTADTTVVTACDSYTWAENGITYTLGAIYTEPYTSITGCDSTITLNLTLNTANAGVTNNNDLTITANEVNATYQWLDCDNSYAVITGETAQTFTATANGNYAVEVTSNGCTDTSSCVTINDVSIETLNPFGSVTLSPNPTKSIATLTFGKVIANGNVVISDVKGRVLNTITLNSAIEATIEINGEAGIYFIQISDDANQRKTLRLIKE